MHSNQKNKKVQNKTNETQQSKWNALTQAFEGTRHSDKKKKKGEEII